MRTKKLFSLLLAVLMLCSLSVSAFAAETAQASVPVVLTVVNSVSPISVSVPACLPVTVLDGYVVTASNAVIENRAQSGAVQVVAVDVQPGAFAIGDFENFGSEAGKIAFSINGCKTVKEGKLTLADDLRQRGLQRLCKQRRSTVGRIPQPDHTGLVRRHGEPCDPRSCLLV